MAVNDPIADLLTRIRNAGRAEHRYVDVSWSKIKEGIARILSEQGFVGKVLVREVEGRKEMRIILKYVEGRLPVIQGLKRVSSPGQRQYVTHAEIPRVVGGLGISILTTSRGLMTGHKARKEGVGGEVLCLVW